VVHRSERAQRKARVLELHAAESVKRPAAVAASEGSMHAIMIHDMCCCSHLLFTWLTAFFDPSSA
jgi:hypothetical protein